MNYLSKYLPATVELCEALCRLTFMKTEWTWNRKYQNLFDGVKACIKGNACMKFNNKVRPLYLETDVSGIGLGVGLLQVRDGMNCPHDKMPNSILKPTAFANERLHSTERRYRNIEREALGTLQGLDTFHHYCFAREGKYHIRPQAPCSHFQERCSNTIAEIAGHATEDMPVHTYSYRVVLKADPCREQLHRNIRH